MAYTNSRHSGRLIIISRLRDAFAELHIGKVPAGASEVHLEGAELLKRMYLLQEVGAEEKGDLFNFPFLLHKDGTPWHEANSYLLDLVINKSLIGRPTDDLRRRASKLLDYLLYCEDNKLNWLDFSGRRPASRPTYKYFTSLVQGGIRSPAVINQYTGVVYDFYKFVSCNWHYLDLARVDTVKQVKILLQGEFGNRLVTAEKRSQTKPTPSASPVPIGFVREDGEDLRPLSNSELNELLKVLDGDDWSTQERLIILSSLMTGARKQTVLTMRLKNLQTLLQTSLQQDGTYPLRAGPGTGMDTKRDRVQRLYIPEQLALELNIFVESPTSERRRQKFLEGLRENHSLLSGFGEDDSYVFLSDQGGCYYMGKDDPRYPSIKSRPTGQVTDTIKRKLLEGASSWFPKDFSYHWLRATYAFQLYQFLQPALKDGRMHAGEEISFIQHRLHHKDRETTENYLKLFRMHSEKLAAQELYESHLFRFGSINDLIVE